MVERIHRGLGTLIWRTLIAGLIGLAVYVSGMRLVFQLLPTIQDRIVVSLSQQVGADIHVEKVSGQLVGFAPRIDLTALRVTSSSNDAVIEIPSASVTLDPWNTLLALSPRLDAMQLHGARIGVDLAAANRQPARVDNDLGLSGLTDLLLVFRKVTIAESQMTLTNGDGASLTLDTAMELRREGSLRRFELRLEDGTETLATLAGEGIGDIFDGASFRGEVHGSVDSSELKSLLSLAGLQASGAGHVDFWYQVQSANPELTVVAGLENIAIDVESSASVDDDSKVSAPLIVDRADLRGIYRPTETGWRATLDTIGIEIADQVLNLGKVQLASRGANLEINLEQVSVGQISGVLLASNVMPKAAEDVIATLNPRGHVVALSARLEDVAAPLSGWSAIAEVTDATVDPFEGVPGLAGIDATVEGDQDGATAWIATTDFALDLPRVYRDPIRFQEVRGQLSAHWRSDALFLERGLLHATDTDHGAVIEFGIDIPLDSASTQAPDLAMNLSVGFGRAPVAIRDRYIPYIVDENLYDWLAGAIPAGEVASGAFIWRGPFDDYGEGDQSLQLGLNLVDTELRFEENWPSITDLDATLLLDTERLSVWGLQGNMTGISAQDVSVELAADPNANLLYIQSNLSSGLAPALATLAATPINDTAGGVLSDLSGEGQLSGELALTLDLDDITSTPAIALALDVNASQLRSTLLDLDVSDVRGDLTYSDTTGFGSRGLTGDVLGEPMTVAIGAGSSGLPDHGVFDARFAVPFDAESGGAWLAALIGTSPETMARRVPLTGETNILVDIAVGEAATVRVTSDLAGLGIDLPKPVGKSQSDNAPLQLSFEIGADQPWSLFWYGRATARLLRQDDAFIGASVDLTPRTRLVTLPDPVISEGIYITGFLPLLTVEPWLAAWDRMEFDQAESGVGVPVTMERLTVDDVLVGGADIGPINLDLTPYETWDMLGINADWLDAELTLRDDGSQSSLIINALDLDGLPSLEGDSGFASSPKPPDFTAPLTVVVANLTFAGRPLGAVTFDLTSADGTLNANEIRGQLAGMELREGSALVWSEQPDGSYGSRLSLDAKFRDVGLTFQALDMEPPIETRSGTVSADLSWPGGPTDVDYLQLDGAINTTLKDGSFLPVPSGATGFMRILSVLNLAGLFERANVTRLFEPGVTFKNAKGVFEFEPGRVDIPSFVVDGSGGGFEFDSDINLLTQTIDGELIVTLPLAENIPWVAALAGGIPIAAGAYLVSKIFEDQVKSLSSGVYSVTGDLEQPDVKFVRVFDATSNKVRKDGSEGSDVKEGSATKEKAEVSEEAEVRKEIEGGTETEVGESSEDGENADNSGSAATATATEGSN